MSNHQRTQGNKRVSADSISEYDFLFFDEELPVRDAIGLLIGLWEVAQVLSSEATYPIEVKAACYWLMRVILSINLESDEVVNVLYNQIGQTSVSSSMIAPADILEDFVPIRNICLRPNNGGFSLQLSNFEGNLRDLEGSNILRITEHLFLKALKAVILLADSGHFRPLNERTVDGLVVIAQAAYSLDLSKFSSMQTSELVTELAHKCVDLNVGSQHLGLAINALRVIFEKMGNELTLKGSAMFVRAVNMDNPYYSPGHNTLLAKTIQQWSFWARQRRREQQHLELGRRRQLEPEEFFLLSFILSETDAKTALVNVEEGRIEFMESLKLFLENQSKLKKMLNTDRRIRAAALKCGMSFSEVQFLMFNQISFGWCSGYGAGVSFDFTENNSNERQLLWQHFDLETIAKLLDRSVQFIKQRIWRKDYGVSRIQFISSTLECILGVFRHVDLFKMQPCGLNLEERIIGWIQKILMSATPKFSDDPMQLPLRDISIIMGVMSSTKRSLHADGFLPFPVDNRLEEKIEEIINQQFEMALQSTVDMFYKINTCIETHDEYVVGLHAKRTTAILPSKYRPLITKNIYYASAIVEELITQTAKGIFTASEFLLQLVKAKREDLATLWLFVVAKLFDTYESFNLDQQIWSELSKTEQEVFKRNMLIATTIIDAFLRAESEGIAPYFTQALELGLVEKNTRKIIPKGNFTTLKWLSPALKNIIHREITRYRPSYGDETISVHDGQKNRNNTVIYNWREKGTFANSFEAQVFGLIQEFLESSRKRGLLKSFALRPNIRIFKCEIDLVVELRLPNDAFSIILVECEGESWHSTFGVRNDLDVAKDKIKRSPALWKLVGIDTIPEIVAISHRLFRSKNANEQRRYIELLVNQWLS